MRIDLYDTAGHRKYLTRAERDRFLRTAATCLGEVQTFCSVLAYTGCHMTEALELTYERVNLRQHTLTFETLRTRGRRVLRTVPVSPTLLAVMDTMHHIQEHKGRRRYRLVWPWSRTTAWRHIHAVMARAEIHGPHASAKGLRHGFGVLAVEQGIPLPLIQQWMGHADLESTVVYTMVMPHETRSLAAKLWNDPLLTR